MTAEQKAMRRAWVESHFGDKNLTDEELDCATYMPSENFSDGWDKGVDFALSHQWVSVDDRLPNEHEEVLTYSIASECTEDEIATAYYDGEDWHTLQGRPIRPNFWMLIPKLNPEK